MEFWCYVLHIRLIKLLKISFRYNWISGVQNILTIPTCVLRKSAVNRNNHPDGVMPTQYFTITLSHKSPSKLSENFCGVSIGGLWRTAGKFALFH